MSLLLHVECNGLIFVWSSHHFLSPDTHSLSPSPVVFDVGQLLSQVFSSVSNSLELIEAGFCYFFRSQWARIVRVGDQWNQFSSQLLPFHRSSFMFSCILSAWGSFILRSWNFHISLTPHKLFSSGIPEPVPCFTCRSIFLSDLME